MTEQCDSRQLVQWGSPQGPKVLLDLDHDPCPCGSKVAIGACCLRDGMLAKRPSCTRPPGSPTKYAHQHCYAHRLNDCDGTLSREHWISEGTLRLLAQSQALTFRGMRWQEPGASHSLPPRRMASRVLCRRHNSALSSLDVCGTAFVRALLLASTTAEHSYSSNKTQIIHLANGSDIERWLLKIFIGGTVSRSLSLNGCRVNEWLPSQHYIDYLFGVSTSLPIGGLYFTDPNGMAPAVPEAFNVAIYKHDWVPAGLVANIGGFQLCVTDAPRTYLPLANGSLRPTEIVANSASGSRVIVLTWDEPGDGHGIVFGPVI